MTEGRHRSFKTPAARTDPVTFDINGERFTCRPTHPGAAIPELQDALAGDPETGKVSTEAIMGVITSTMEEPEAERLKVFVEDPANIVHANLLLDIALYLVEEYAGRPFGLRSVSSSGPGESGPTSTDSPPSED